jgi:3-oxoacyl-[acyl-carrier protein] reductase
VRRGSARAAIVTGGGRGIGAATVHRLAEDGFAVGVLDIDADGARDTAAAVARAGGRTVAVEVDVSDAGSVGAAVDQVARTLGEPLVLVNNAGVTRDNLLHKASEEDWDDVIRVHLRGAFLMSRAAQGHMTAAGWGRIVNVSSTSALGNRGQANYSAAKAGLQGFTKTLAIELGRFGVTVNAVAPGFVATEMTDRTAQRLGLAPEQLRQKVASSVAVRRVGEPADVAQAVSFFVDERSSYVTGQVLYVSGGPAG